MESHRPGQLAVFRWDGPETSAGALDDRFRAAGWRREPAPGGEDLFLYTKGRRRCLVGVQRSSEARAVEVMVLCDR